MRRPVILGVSTLAAVTVVLPLAAAWAVWKRPLAVDAWRSRVALKKAGLRKNVLKGPAGRLTVWEGGSGPVLILLHGAGDQAGAWSRVAPELIAHHRLIVPDLPGHGGSAPGTGPLHLEDVLAGVEAVLDARVPAGPPVTLVGNSLGAWIATLYAVDHPGRVERLVLVNGGPLTGRHDPGILMPKNRRHAARLIGLLMGPSAPPVPGFVLDDIVRWSHSGPVGRLAASGGEMGRFVLDGRLDRVTTPVDLLWGAADGLMGLGYARRLLEGLPAARLTTIEGCGHVPQRQCPGRFVEALGTLLAQPAPDAKARDEE